MRNDTDPGLPVQAGHYTGVAKSLHWLMAAIWITAWVLGITAVYCRDELNPHHAVTIAHKAIASTILFLVVLRVAWRLTHRPPELPSSMSRRMRLAAHAGHIALYALALIALPVSGWVWSSVADKPVMTLWLLHLPPLTTPSLGSYGTAKLVHVTLAWSMGAMVGGHILIALKHYFADKDGVLEGMLPRTSTRRSWLPQIRRSS
ncbi:cytochrome B [Sphingomonas sp. Leaf25]|nr:cytochrome B [Sphingomonas sp. Leaf25]